MSKLNEEENVAEIEEMADIIERDGYATPRGSYLLARKLYNEGYHKQKVNIVIVKETLEDYRGED